MNSPSFLCFAQVRFGTTACLAASLPRCFAASLPRCLAASLPRCLAASLPRCLAASLPRCLAASLPRCLAASLPRYLFNVLFVFFLQLYSLYLATSCLLYCTIAGMVIGMYYWYVFPDAISRVAIHVPELTTMSNLRWPIWNTWNEY